MTSELPGTRISPGSRFAFTPHNCFACGTLNTNGLQLDLHLETDRSWAELRLDRRFEGWEGMAHGGIVCTILDEVMAWSLVAADHWGVTARMAVDFRKPLTVGALLRAEGWITRSRRRVIETAARIVDVATGVELATATGTYVAADDARRAELRERYGVRPLTADATTGPIERDTPESVAQPRTQDERTTVATRG